MRKKLVSHQIASAAEKLGFGCVLGNSWTYAMWEAGYIRKFKPSIEYLELYALVAGVLTWEFELRNLRMIVNCDNQAVVSMINQMSSTCPHCMHLIRILVLNSLKFNRRVFGRYLTSKQNYLSDALSRGKIDKFKKLAPKTVNEYPDKLNKLMWPASKLWKKFV